MKATVVLALLLSCGPARAHEFWISPDRYEVAIGDRIVLRLRVGEHLKGNSYRYNPAKFDRFTATMDSGTFELVSRLGDDPAASYVAREPRLHVTAYQARPEQITYTDIAKFRDYLSDEGLAAPLGIGISASQMQPVPFAETYTRYAKALVQVGPADRTDTDVPLSLAYELVARGNPYAGGKHLAVALLVGGTPLAGAPVSLLCRSTTVTRTLLKTDADGLVQVALGSCDEYLLNAVQIERIVPSKEDDVPVVWHSHWASLSFGRS